MEEQRQAQGTSRIARAAGPAPAAPAGLTPREIIGILRQHVWLIVLLTIAGLIVGGGSWYLLERYLPMYTATAYVEVLSAAEKDPMQITPYMVSRDIQYSYRRTLASEIVQQGFFIDLLNRDKIRETEWFRNFGGAGRGGEDEISVQKAITKALPNLDKNLRASAEREIDLITVSMTCGNKEEAAIITNEVMDLFILRRGGQEIEDIRGRLRVFLEQKTNVQNELSTIQKNLDTLRLDSGFGDLERYNYMDVLTQRLADLELAHNDLILEVTNIEAMVKALERQAKDPIAEQISRMVENDPVMITLLQARVGLEAELASRLSRYGENHRVVQQIQERVKEIDKKRKERKTEIGELIAQANLMNGQDGLVMLRSRLDELNRQRKGAEEDKKELDLARVKYGDLIIQRDEKQKALEVINSAIATYRVKLDDPETSKVRKMGDAPVPLEVSFPRWEMFFPGGTLLGFLLSIGIAFAIERLNDIVRTPRDVGRYLRVPLLGMVPDVDEDEQLDGIDPVLAVNKAPYSVVAESYRRFRSNLKLAMPVSKVFLISSGMAGDGKTSVAVNLATTLAGQNNKVLLIDANFWRPNIDVIFPPSEPVSIPKAENSSEGDEDNGKYELGLSTVLAGLCGYHEVIRSSDIENLDVIGAGMLPPNPAELMGGAAMEQFIKYQREKYDYVVIDGPPVLLVSDVKMLAGIVDGTILVFNAMETTRGAALRTIAELNQVKATIFGCVLFAVQMMKGGYFREQYKAYREYQKLQMANVATPST